MIIRSAINDSGEEQRVVKKPLDGFDEKGRKVPGVGQRRREGSGMFEISIEGRRLREIVKVFKGSRMSRDVLFVRRFYERNLYHTCGRLGQASTNTP
jgi:hypothetical protein